MSPQSESPSVHPTSGEMNVTDSGCTEAAVKPARGGDGEGDALGVRVGDGAMGGGELVACGVVGAVEWLLQPASRSAATTTPSREATITTVKRGGVGPVSICGASTS